MQLCTVLLSSSDVFATFNCGVYGGAIPVQHTAAGCISWQHRCAVKLNVNMLLKQC